MQEPIPDCPMGSGTAQNANSVACVMRKQPIYIPCYQYTSPRSRPSVDIGPNAAWTFASLITSTVRCRPIDPTHAEVDIWTVKRLM